jgi:DNA-binding response OmpR family regulator
MYKIVVIDDEEDIADLIAYTLKEYDVITFLDLDINTKEIIKNADLVLMDRNLPSIEGSLYIENLRKEGIDTPVIYISAKDSQDNILEGFDRGGDDYITKPFNINELKARVKAILKRVKKSKVLKYKDILFNLESREVFVNNQKISLTHLEKELLLEFMNNINKVLSREVLLDRVWKDSFETQLKTVNVAVKRLKEKIGKEYIKSIRGEGYMFC